VGKDKAVFSDKMAKVPQAKPDIRGGCPGRSTESITCEMEPYRGFCQITPLGKGGLDATS
jgi:hypothetical protein